MSDNQNYDVNDDPNAPVMSVSEQQQTDILHKKKPYEEAFENVKRNFSAGPGRIALFVIMGVLLLSILIAVRGFNKTTEVEKSTAKIEIPSAPRQKVLNGEVTKEEHYKRNQVHNQNAEDARSKGESYIPPFDTNVVNQNRDEAGSKSSDGTMNDSTDDKQTYGKTMPSQQQSKPSQLNQLNEKQLQELQKSFTEEARKRDAYVKNIQDNTIKQIESLLGGKDGKSGINNLGTYSQVTFSSSKPESNSTQKGNSNSQQGNVGSANKSSRVLIKTGTTLYAQTDGAVNTDESLDVYGTIVGGEWDNSAIIGKVQKTQDNINLVFSVLAPKDDRPKMQIRAVALRLEDAGQGLADKKDYHTIERWGSLAASSLLTGYGQAYQGIGTTTNSNSTTTQTKPEPSNKEIVANMLGEIGSNAASEIKEGFNRPATYSTEGQKAFVLYFVEDATASN